MANWDTRLEVKLGNNTITNGLVPAPVHGQDRLMADDAARADIGVTGLAVMGRNLARNFARHGFTVAVHNRTPSRVDELVGQFGDEGDFVPSHDLADCRRRRRGVRRGSSGR